MAHPEEMEKIKILSAGNKGFTLLELIVVIFIVGVSMSIVVVSISKTYKKTVFRETSKRVFVTLKRAREIALLEKAPVTFKVDVETNSFWIEKNGVIYDRAQDIPQHIRISGEPIIFFPKGNSSGGLVKIEDERERGSVIEVDPVLGTPTVKGI